MLAEKYEKSKAIFARGATEGAAREGRSTCEGWMLEQVPTGG
jgi:hypothetical protein